ncbi:unnamed protein product [Choristocarpus tenellus]
MPDALKKKRTRRWLPISARMSVRTSSPSPGPTRNSWSGPWTTTQPTPEEPLQDIRQFAEMSDYRFTIFAVFRGGWCMSSQQWLRGLHQVYDDIATAGGQVVAICSQTQTLADNMGQDAGLPFRMIGDPNNSYVGQLNELFDLGCEICVDEVTLEGYPRGMAQFSFLAVNGQGMNGFDDVLYKWKAWQVIEEREWGRITKQSMSCMRSYVCV